MGFRSRLACCLALSLAAPAAQADLTDKQPSYTRIAAKCGEDPSRPSFSAADYAAALGDAAKALKPAKAEGNRARQDAIAQSVAQLKECQKAEDRKFHVPKIATCQEFVSAYTAFSARAAGLIASGKITDADRTRVREAFRAPAEACVRRLMSKCVDPNNASEVDLVVKSVEAASEFGFVYTYSRQSGLDLFMTKNMMGNLTLKFCTDTDYACKGEAAFCARRVERIKGVMQTYMED